MIYLVDNYDSFVHNLARYFRLLGQETVVIRNDGFEIKDLAGPEVDAIVISPGPCSPDEAGKTLELIVELHQRKPVLGICLGHQAIVQALGGKVVRSSRPMHGQSSDVRHDNQFEFENLPNPFSAGRYHSLVAEPNSVPTCLEASAWTEDGTIMAVRHRDLPVVGWQFHPESILTEDGFTLLSRFLEMAGIAVTKVPTIERERKNSKFVLPPVGDFPTKPITF